MSLFGGSKKRTLKALAKGPPLDPKWARTAGGRFHRLARLDPEARGLAGVSGVYVIWHAGLRPGWVYIGRSADLARALNEVAGKGDVMAFEARGGLYVTWSLIRAEFQEPVVRYLSETLKPLVKNGDVENAESPAGDATMIPVRAPCATGVL